jgi:hypothetical protein
VRSRAERKNDILSGVLSVCPGITSSTTTETTGEATEALLTNKESFAYKMTDRMIVCSSSLLTRVLGSCTVTDPLFPVAVTFIPANSGMFALIK